MDSDHHESDYYNPSSSSSNQLVFDVNDPLYVHPSDIPNLHLVPHELCGSENYGVWSKATKLALKCNSKLGFIDGKFPKPSADSPYLDQWEKCNSLVLSWILKCVSHEIYNGLVYCDTAFDTWSDLYDQFNKMNRARIFSLFRDINSHVQGANSITIYYSRLRQMWEEYDSLLNLPHCECAASKAFSDYSHEHKLMQFLIGLNDYYSSLKSQILMMNPSPTYKQAYSMICNEESHRLMQGPHINTDSSISLYSNS